VADDESLSEAAHAEGIAPTIAKTKTNKITKKFQIPLIRIFITSFNMHLDFLIGFTTI
jgi:hypothetical protein